MADNILEMRNISKAFPGVQALDNVSFKCKKGEVMALVGENGAGKSTLMKILVGVYQADKGEIILRGERVKVTNPREAQKLGISIIYQELNLLPYLDVAENILLGREPRRGLVINMAELYFQANEWLKGLSIGINPRTPVYKLSVAQQQMVEIIKALSLNANLIIMDEPSSSLSGHELNSLFDRIHLLQSKGITVIYISHRLDEIFEVADRVTVLKDGKLVGTLGCKTADKSTLIRMMVGRTLDETYPEKAEAAVSSKEVFSVVDLSSEEKFQNINFKVHKGEILGIAGLVGAGRTELAKAIFGAEPPDKGEIYLNGEKIDIDTPNKAIKSGIGFVTEDRRKEGLIIGLSVRKNITLPSLNRVTQLGFIDNKEERKIVKGLVRDLDIKTPSIDWEVEYLSGGNQQKVILAKWLATMSQFIIFDEPTRGIDVGAKAEIYHLMRELAKKGIAILMISSELPEILGMCDRILVMHEGHIAGELPSKKATEEEIMFLATGGK